MGLGVGQRFNQGAISGSACTLMGPAGKEALVCPTLHQLRVSIYSKYNE